MKPLQLIEKYYPRTSEAYRILVTHSHMVYQKAFYIACQLTDLEPDLDFIYEACMLHDIGITLTKSPGIDCHGEHSYICHGYLGREILEKEGLPRHALVCERHTGVGLTLQEIIEQNLPLPHRDMVPISLEEQIICYADKFYSKNRNYLRKEKSVIHIEKQLRNFGEKKVLQFRKWKSEFSRKKVRR